MTLQEFEKAHPTLAHELRLLTGDWVTGRTPTRYTYRGAPHEVTGVYDAYEEGVRVWYAMVEAHNGTDMAIYKDGKWAYSDTLFWAQ